MLSPDALQPLPLQGPLEAAAAATSTPNISDLDAVNGSGSGDNRAAGAGAGDTREVVFVIGGIVDRTVRKGVTRDFAVSGERERGQDVRDMACMRSTMSRLVCVWPRGLVVVLHECAEL